MNAQEARTNASLVKSKLIQNMNNHSEGFKKVVQLTLAEYRQHIESAVKNGEMYVSFTDTASGDLFEEVKNILESEGYTVKFGGWDYMTTITW